MKNAFLWKIFSRIFIVIVAIFVIAMGISAYKYYRAIHADDPIDPYVFVEKGASRIVRGNITIQLTASEKYDIQEQDTIIVEADSESTIFWPDRSTTQLGADSVFAIQKMQVADDYSKIDIEATILRGKMHTNMIRTLYPGSKMTVKIPKNNITAGVRGTIFSINLEKNYIYSVNHAVTLQNALWQKTLLLPDEISSLSNIFSRLWKDALDAVWEKSVQIKNELYEQKYLQEISSAWEKLMGKIAEKSWWDEFMRWVLSWFNAFRDIALFEQVSSLDIGKIAEYSHNELLALYQKLKIGNFALERDMLRGAVYQIAQADAKMQEILEILATESLWDKMSFPTLDLQNAEQILNDFSKKMTIDWKAVYKNLSEKDYSAEVLKSLENFFTSPILSR